MKKIRKKLKVSQVFVYAGLSFWALTTIFPLIWVHINSFKDTNDIIDNSFTLPTSFFLDNYKEAFENHIIRGYMNSLIISCSVVIGVLVCASLAAFILARFRFRGRSFIVMLVTGSILIPVFATILPTFEIVLWMGLNNQRLGLILPQIAGNLAFAILIITSFMSTIPNELEEAAQVEGCTSLQVLSKIFIPISKPSLATTAIFVFLWSYNDLFTSLIIIRDQVKAPINVLLTTIASQYGTDYGLMTAVITIIIIPVLIFYMIAQKQIVEGMTSGAVKG